jgi:DNA helicase-2/ATP-dependent DNA helicase PcrA
MFIWEKGVLNPQQEKAILDDRSILIVACPGSGKTKTLTYKIAYELSRLRSEREFIVAITYTNIAAEEIKERIELLGVDISQLWIGTIHSFCLEWILRPYALYLDELKFGFRILNAHESEELISKLCAPYKRQKVTYYDCGFVAKTSGIFLTCLDTAKHASIKIILQQYFTILKQNHQIDFEQILYYSFKLLNEKNVISSILSKLFPYILVDEYQDTKEIQYHIISSILAANNGKSRTLIVGDPNQSIYESLGGFPMTQQEIEVLLKFPLVQHELSSNYRSSEKIIKYFDCYRSFENSVIAAGLNKDYKSVITFNDTVKKADLIEEIVKLILYNVYDKGISPNEICVAAPQWVHLASLTRNLMVKLPDFNFDGPGMAPFSRDIDNFWYKLSRIALTEPSPHLYMKRIRWSKEILYELNVAGVNVDHLTPKLFLKFCNSIEIDEDKGLAYLENLFSQVLEYLKIRITTFKTLHEHYNSFFDSSKSRIEKLRKEGNEFIGTIESFRKVFKQRGGITVSTIHGVKGQEYDTMIGFALLEDYVPHFKDPKGQENSKKLLYVLSSRARKNLHLISERGRLKPYGSPPQEYKTTIQLNLNKYDYDS